MNFKSSAKKTLIAAGVYPAASRSWMWLEPRVTRVVRALNGRNESLVRSYLATSASPRLHIGCGGNHLDGWLNTELMPRGDEIYLDATRPFPFPDRSFDLIYTEHMIEHIPFEGAERMVRECCRVLRPGGTIRIVTPDMAFLRSLLNGNDDRRREAYFDFYKTHHLFGEPLTATHFVNRFVRSWGHQFIYDGPVLIDLLRAAGFVNVGVTAFNRSDVPGLDGLAKVDRMPDGLLEMESLTVEGTRPQ